MSEVKLIDFPDALRASFEGKKIAREDWNGKGQYVVMMPALFLEAGMVNGRTRKYIGENKDLDSQPYFALMNAQGKWQPGWIPSQGDLFSKKWYIVE